MRKLTASLISIIIIFSSAACIAADTEAAETAQYLLSQTPMPISASVGGEWVIIGINRAGIEVNERYFENYLTRASAKFKSGEGFGKKYTEYSRITIAFNILGCTEYNTELLKYVNDYDNVIYQGINGPIFALEAKYAAKDTDSEIRRKYISYILSQQNSDGSFGLSSDTPDVDITAMTIAALSRYKNDDINIIKSINKAFLYLSSVQMPNGGFCEAPGEREINCESTAQVIIAMKRFGIKPDCSFFTKNGNTPQNALDTFRCADGSYKHMQYDTQSSRMSTEQALLALTEPSSNTASLIYDSIWFESNIKCINAIK